MIGDWVRVGQSVIGYEIPVHYTLYSIECSTATYIDRVVDVIVTGFC